MAGQPPWLAKGASVASSSATNKNVVPAKGASNKGNALQAWLKNKKKKTPAK